MINRRIEYTISCDAKRVLGKDCPDFSTTAFGDISQADCVTSAKESGWFQVSKRLWLCPRCSKDLNDKTKQRRGVSDDRMPNL